MHASAEVVPRGGGGSFHQFSLEHAESENRSPELAAVVPILYINQDSYLMDCPYIKSTQKYDSNIGDEKRELSLTYWFTTFTIPPWSACQLSCYFLQSFFSLQVNLTSPASSMIQSQLIAIAPAIME